MLNKRLLGLLPEAKKYTAISLLFQWLALICSISASVCISMYIYSAFAGKLSGLLAVCLIPAILLFVFLRGFFTKKYVGVTSESARFVKKKMRSLIFSHLCKTGASYKKHVTTAEAVQVGVDGIDQLESYFSGYIPQLFYAGASTVTLFVFLSFVCFPAAITLLICVPLIPMAIIAVQKIAKRLLSKYWDSYTTLGDSFLENIQGLTTLKIYRADEAKHIEMNKNAESFRKATMRVLVMQLNSIAVMDIVAYAGAAAGIITAVIQLAGGNITIFAALIVILLSAEFFIPVRTLGSFFHTAMNSSAAADKIFKIIDIEAKDKGCDFTPDKADIRFENVSFGYDGGNQILHNICLEIPKNGLYALAGTSGCGKSTIAKILMGEADSYTGSISVGGKELSEISEKSLYNIFSLVSHNSYIFKGSVRYNLCLAKESADDTELISVLKKVRLWDFLEDENGLDTEINEQGSILSGGQRQRLALARALLADTLIYIFDEATSNIDAESENAIGDVISELAKEKLVILISHRLANIVGADKIFVLKNGAISESGTHAELMEKRLHYAKIYSSQKELESYILGGDGNE